ncbi:hypothetical protein BJX76DRAFT_344871 [Aspergillus varians]
MADTTSHDTVGASTLAAAPYFPSSSPSPSERPLIDSPDRLPSPVSSQGARSPSGSPPPTRDASIERAARELDARLAQYTVDFSQFPSGHGPDDALDEQPDMEEEADRLSAVGGPEDFTANLERYLLGEEDSVDQEIDDEDNDQEQPQETLNSESELPQSQDDEQPERRAAPQPQQPAVDEEAELGEYSEFGPPVDMSTPSHLLRRNADIEEDPDDEPSPVATPTVRKTKSPINKDAKLADEDLRRQILERNRNRVLEAASAGEEIKHLRAELQRKVVSRRSSINKSEFEMQKTISMLRQQLSMTQEQLRKRDTTLDETIAKLKENAEIDKLPSRIHRDYRALEDQMILLETKNRPLEEKNSTLEADLTRAQSQVTAQENALKVMAADLPTDTPGGTYNPNTSRPTKPRDSELAKLRTESSERAATNKSLEAQLSRAHDQAAESQLLIQSIEAENTRLTHDDLTRLRTEHSKALETIERLQETQQTQQPSPPPTPHTTNSNLEATHKAQITNLRTSHATALSTLRTAHADSTRKLRSLLAASEKREADLRAELDQTTTQTQTHHSDNKEEGSDEETTQKNDLEIASLRAEINHLYAVIASKDETAAAMDLRIAKSVEKREREWERRVELLLKEREKMGKALLWSWGEKEGKGSEKAGGGEDDKERRQAYRYKYVKRT